MFRTHRLLRTGALAVTMVAALAGCATASGETSQHSDYSRVRYYQSLGDLAEDSSAVVYGVVVDQEVVADIDPITNFTLSTLRVDRVIKGDSVEKDDRVVIRQFGKEGDRGPSPLMTVGSSYLLYLTLSGLPGPQSTQYYVTGGNAGLFGQADAKSRTEEFDASFRQLAPDEGDALPRAVTLSEAIAQS